MLKLYHLIPFFLFWISIEKEFNNKIVLPDYSQFSFIYMFISILSLLLFLKKNTTSQSFEKMVIILSFVTWTKILMKVFDELKFPDLFHSVFILTFIMSLRNDIIHHSNIKKGYFVCLMYTCFANLTRQQNVTSSLIDYFTVHCLFYLLK